MSGIWADDSGDEGEFSGHRGFGTKPRGRKKFDTSAPISFIAGGVQQAGKKGKKDEEKKKSDDEMMDEDEDPPRRKFGSSSRLVHNLVSILLLKKLFSIVFITCKFSVTVTVMMEVDKGLAVSPAPQKLTVILLD